MLILSLSLPHRSDRTLGVISHITVAVAAFWLDIPGR